MKTFLTKRTSVINHCGLIPVRWTRESVLQTYGTSVIYHSFAASLICLPPSLTGWPSDRPFTDRPPVPGYFTVYGQYVLGNHLFYDGKWYFFIQHGWTFLDARSGIGNNKVLKSSFFWSFGIERHYESVKSLEWDLQH